MLDRSPFRPNLDIFGIPRLDPGWLYVVQSGDLIKIGKTTNPEQRLKRDAKTWLPDLEIIGIKPFWNISRLERMLHVALVENWHKGEWYKFYFPADYEFITEGFSGFYNDDRDMNSVDFIYWYNGSGMAEWAIENENRGLTLPKWRRSESFNI